MKYIFVVGAPGSRWSGVANSIYYSEQIDQSDDTPKRTYFNPKSPPKAKKLMHRGAYFDPGMEFGHELENFDINKWGNDLKVGLTGSFICTRIFGSLMSKNKGGVILNISSDLGIIAPNLCPRHRLCFHWEQAIP